MWKALLSFLLCTYLSADAQITQQEYQGKEAIVLSPWAASVVEYWGQKGILADPVIRSLETEIKILNAQVELYRLSNQNLIDAQLEYRAMVSRSAGTAAALQEELRQQRTETQLFQSKAMRRGKLLVAAAIIVGGVLYLNLSQ